MYLGLHEVLFNVYNIKCLIINIMLNRIFIIKGRIVGTFLPFLPFTGYYSISFILQAWH